MVNINKPMTSKQAKRAYQKRGGNPQLTDKQIRQLDRASELYQRAEKIKEKERRAKENARKKEEKEEKLKEQRIRQGLPAIPEPKVRSSQRRINGFFVNAGAAKRKSEVDVSAQQTEDEGTGAEQTGDEDVSRPTSRGTDSERPESRQTETESRPESRADDSVVMVAGSENVPRPASRKRRYSASVAPTSTQPVRKPGAVTDPLVSVNRREIWVPPSQNTIKHKRPRSAGSDSSTSNRSIVEWTIEEQKAHFMEKMAEIDAMYPLRQASRRYASQSPSNAVQHEGETEDQTVLPEHVTTGTVAHDSFMDLLDGFPSDSQVNLDVGSAAQPTIDTESKHGGPPMETFKLKSPVSLRFASSTRKMDTAMAKVAEAPERSDEDMLDLFPSDSQVFTQVAEPAVTTSRKTTEVSFNVDDLVDWFPSDSQVLLDQPGPQAKPVVPVEASLSRHNKIGSATKSLEPKKQVSRPQSAMHVSEHSLDDFADMLPSDSRIFDAVSSPASRQVRDLQAPQVAQPTSQTKTSTQPADDLLIDITSSQLAELDQAVDLDEPNDIAGPQTPRPVASAGTDFQLSQFDLAPDEAAALEAEAVTTPIAKAASPRKSRGLERTETTVSDVSEFEISSQELRALGC